jgi:hypothetical protein
MNLVDVGYLPKKITPRPSWLEAPNVRLVCSVSCCIAGDPPDRLRDWNLNDFGFFDTVAAARGIVPADDADEYHVFAYRLYPRRFDEGMDEAVDMPELHVEPYPPSFGSLGFDAVSRSTSSFFECSPLSCNNGARDLITNELCLFDTLDEAIAEARVFSIGNSWEPGPYYVLEVLADRSRIV